MVALLNKQYQYLVQALELFTSWLIEDNYTHVTLPAYTCHTTWPLSAILPFYKKRQVNTSTFLLLL